MANLMAKDIRARESRILDNLGEALVASNADLFSEEFYANIYPTVIQSIQGNAAVPREAVISAVIHGCTIESTNITHAIQLIDLVLAKMVERGEITSVFWTSENRSGTEYWPKGSTFEVAPYQSIISGQDIERHMPILDSQDTAQANAILTLLKSHNNPTRLYVISHFCPACGALESGHVCTG